VAVQPRTLRRPELVGAVGPVPHGALHQVHVGGERGAARAAEEKIGIMPLSNLGFARMPL
jgi:hypothetical protein